MSNPFINSIVSWFLKKRSHQIELFMKYPNEVQNDVLINLINTAKDTEIGKELALYNLLIQKKTFRHNSFILKPH